MVHFSVQPIYFYIEAGQEWYKTFTGVVRYLYFYSKISSGNHITERKMFSIKFYIPNISPFEMFKKFYHSNNRVYRSFQKVLKIILTTNHEEPFHG